MKTVRLEEKSTQHLFDTFLTKYVYKKLNLYINFFNFYIVTDNLIGYCNFLIHTCIIKLKRVNKKYARDSYKSPKKNL